MVHALKYFIISSDYAVDVEIKSDPTSNLIEVNYGCIHIRCVV
jgi:hypothetical protein